MPASTCKVALWIIQNASSFSVHRFAVLTIAAWICFLQCFAFRIGIDALAGQANGPPSAHGTPVVESLSENSVPPGTLVKVKGHGFGSRPGLVLVTGLRMAASEWSDTEVRFVVPADAASGFLHLRSADGARSSPAQFTVKRKLPAGQMAPYGLALQETVLPGAAFLVETDGVCMYRISGFETLCVHRIHDASPHSRVLRTYLNQRVADLRVRGEYLFCVGDHGW